MKITIKKLAFANRSDCFTRRNFDNQYLQCVGNCTATVRFYEVPYKEAYPLPKHCLGSEMQTFLPFTYESSSNTVELEFIVNNMNFTEDYRHHYMEGVFQFIRTSICPENRVVTGSSGEIVFKSPSRTPTEVTVLMFVDLKFISSLFGFNIFYFLVLGEL